MSSKLQNISALRALLDEKKASATELAQEALRNAQPV
jgi:aspartyl-tRNA(Asn)/glutamyl-tRNA(Gln) amidotransferase subunit A